MTVRNRPEILIRSARIGDIAEASALCLRSKAHWGYDEAFMCACRDELTLGPADIENDDAALALEGERLVGVVHLQIEDTHAELEKLFVEPDLIGRGVGRSLFDWAIERAGLYGASEMRVTADPQAEGFYESVGFKRIGEEPSGSIPGRKLTIYTMQLGRS